MYQNIIAKEKSQCLNMTIPFSYSTPEKVDTRAVDTRTKVNKVINMDVSAY